MEGGAGEHSHQKKKKEDKKVKTEEFLTDLKLQSQFYNFTAEAWIKKQIIFRIWEIQLRRWDC